MISCRDARGAERAQSCARPLSGPGFRAMPPSWRRLESGPLLHQFDLRARNRRLAAAHADERLLAEAASAREGYDGRAGFRIEEELTCDGWRARAGSLPCHMAHALHLGSVPSTQHRPMRPLVRHAHTAKPCVLVLELERSRTIN
eukprot:1530079-Prymnesium_polylepis.1